jgi:hypothetical protein
MKTLIYFLVILMGVLASCGKDKNAYEIPIYHEGDQGSGWGEAKRDGKGWKATAFARNHQDGSGYIGIDFNTFTTQGDIRESLSFNEIPLKVGKYQIKGKVGDTYDGLVGSNYGLSESDGDVIGAVYSHDDASTGYIELTNVDTASNVVEGMFDKAVFIRYTPIESIYPETVVFKNGKFRMKIVE